jgi:cyclase
MEGYDLELIRRVASAVTIPVVAVGGAGRLADFPAAVASGASAVGAGSLFVFHGKHRAVLITYPPYAELERLFEAPTS